MSHINHLHSSFNQTIALWSQIGDSNVDEDDRNSEESFGPTGDCRRIIVKLKNLVTVRKMS